MSVHGSAGWRYKTFSEGGGGAKGKEEGGGWEE